MLNLSGDFEVAAQINLSLSYRGFRKRRIEFANCRVGLLTTNFFLHLFDCGRLGEFFKDSQTCRLGWKVIAGRSFDGRGRNLAVRRRKPKAAMLAGVSRALPAARYFQRPV